MQSSRFTREKMISSPSCHLLLAPFKRQVYVTGRAKSFNEKSYYSVDAIHAAIIDAKKIALWRSILAKCYHNHSMGGYLETRPP